MGGWWGGGGRLFEARRLLSFCLQDGRLFEVSTNSRLGAYSNKYGSRMPIASLKPPRQLYPVA